MQIKSAEFVVSNTSISKCPKDNLPEYAFIGRSNVGKSSLINAMVNNKGLAKTSSKPGKTQLINHFLINKEWYLVDLPGYGYAKISIKQREKWAKMIKDYLTKRENLMNVFVLIDSRIPPQKNDIEFINSLAEQNVPLSLVYTKLDKVKQQDFAKNLALFNKTLKQYWDELPAAFFTSAESKRGCQDILEYIDKMNDMFQS